MQFATFGPDKAFDLVRHHTTGRKTGPIFTAMTHLSDTNGDSWEFKIECFSTGYALLTLGFAARRATLIVPAPHQRRGSLWESRNNAGRRRLCPANLRSALLRR
jgi:hypothetical protein